MQDSGIIAHVNEQLGKVEGGVSYGHRVGAMVLNGLGFINTALYLTPQFFHNKPISLLLGEEIRAESLNDDALRRCLDKISAYGTSRWYSEVALQVLRQAGLLSKTAHLDSTTLSLYEAYD